MNVLLVSQCDKRALTETRRILDQFAERKGERTWQTSITMDGLLTLKRLLRKTARKNTGVACHWIRGRDHTELAWIVGDARRFNRDGTVPTNTTARDILKAGDENDWQCGELIELLAGMAALFHDLGKACAAFQYRLRATSKCAPNRYRHEWVSLRLFQAFVGKDDDALWLARLQDSACMRSAYWLDVLQQNRLRDGLDSAAHEATPFAPGSLPPLASAIAWLIVSHHFLPRPTENFRSSESVLKTAMSLISVEWNQSRSAAQSDNPDQMRATEPDSDYWSFPFGLPTDDALWCERVSRFASKLALVAQKDVELPLTNPYLMHLSRLTLMLADHHFSSCEVRQRWKTGTEKKIAFANTLKNSGERRFNQTLNEHLIGVCRESQQVARLLPALTTGMTGLTRHKMLQKRAGSGRFSWQDKAFDCATGLRDKSASQGAFIVNMASTGCGKTLANARIMYGLSDPVLGLRCAFALGLRTLTLQTGRAFRDNLRLDDNDLAIRVGGAPNRELFEHYASLAEATGSESAQSLQDEDADLVGFDGGLDIGLAKQLEHDPAIARLIRAPLLVCTIDHLTPATEGTRGGRQIAPMLRLLTSDLVLDEPDDFDVNDMPALVRLAYWAGLLGSKVLMSSATLTPAHVQGMFDAYLAGRACFQKNRGHPGIPVNVCCMWVDERETVSAQCSTGSAFLSQHNVFVSARSAWLAQQPYRRTAQLLPVAALQSVAKDKLVTKLSRMLMHSAIDLHRENSVATEINGKQASFGLIRIANIESALYPLARALYQQACPADFVIHLTVYHSQFPLLLRSAIEQRLDQTLARQEPDSVFRLPDIRRRLNASPARNHLFIVLASPVAEVGRDHDYDWAIAEPSSVRSLIQLAGRVRRHRPQPYEVVNMLILQQNLRSLRTPEKAAYCRPGFETENDYRLDTHDLSKLLTSDEYAHLDARPRLLPRSSLSPRKSLTDLEHARMQAEINVRPITSKKRSRDPAVVADVPACAASCWREPSAMLHGALPVWQPFRDSTRDDWDLLLVPHEDDNRVHLMHRFDVVGRKGKVGMAEIDSQLQVITDDELRHPDGPLPWGNENYLAELDRLATELDMTSESCALRFGAVSMRRDKDNPQRWCFHPALGLCEI